MAKYRQRPAEEDVSTSKFNCLWNMPGISNTTCTLKEARKFLLETDGEVLAQGHLWDVKAESLGAGIYRVKLEKQDG